MPDKMERFTQRARRVLSLAQEEAERLHHDYIGTEHILLGLMREEGGVAGRVLRDLGLEQRRVEELVERMTQATTRSSSTLLNLSPGSKRVLELAVEEARRMGHHYVGTEYLLLGLVRLSEGVAIDVLKRLGVSPEEVSRQVRRVLQESPAGAVTREESLHQRPGILRGDFGISLPFKRSGAELQQHITQLEQTLAAARASGDQGSEARSLRDLGLVYVQLEDHQKAIFHLEQSLATVAHETDVEHWKALLLSDLAAVYVAAGDKPKAVQYFEQGLALARQVDDRRIENSCERGLAELKHTLRRREKEVKAALRLGNRRAESEALYHVAREHEALGDLQQAKSHYEQALAIARDIGYREWEGLCLGGLGMVYKQRGAYAAAIGHLERALAIFQGDDLHKVVPGLEKQIAKLRTKLGGESAAPDAPAQPI